MIDTEVTQCGTEEHRRQLARQEGFLIEFMGCTFDQLDFGLLPPGATEYQGQVFGSGAIDAPGLGLTRTVIDTDDTPFNPEASTEINPFNAEVLVTVTFDDGSTLTGVDAFQSGSVEFVNNQNVDTRAYAIDVAAVEATGRTLDDVVTADFEAFTTHDLTYDDIGFEAVGTAPDDDLPPPGPEVELSIITGTDGRDRLDGTEDDDILIGGAGNDQLAGGNGADTFVFGSDTGNGTRERDIILDFDVTEDIIALEQGATIARVVTRGDDLSLILSGSDVDRIVIRDVDDSVLDNVLLVTDDFLA